MTTQREAELELEVMRLREALESVKFHLELPVNNNVVIRIAERAINNEFPMPAISALIERVEKMTIERCANSCSGTLIEQITYAEHAAIKKCEKAIRSLPTGKIDIQELMK